MNHHPQALVLVVTLVIGACAPSASSEPRSVPTSTQVTTVTSRPVTPSSEPTTTTSTPSTTVVDESVLYVNRVDGYQILLPNLGAEGQW